MRQDFLEVFVFDGVLALELGGVQRSATSDHYSRTRLNHHSRLKLCNKLTILLLKHGVRNEHIVVEALGETHTGRSLVRAGSNGEWQRGEALVDFDEEGTCTLQLQVVDLVEFTFEDRAALFGFFGLTLASRHENVKANHITRCKFELFNLRGGRRFVQNTIIAINEVLLDLVRQDTLHSVALELLAHLLNHLRHFRVGGSYRNFALCRLEGVPGSQHDVGFAAGDFASAHDDRSRSVGCKTVNVRTTDDLGQISFDKLSRLVSQG